MFDDKSGEYIPVMITVFEYHREGNRIYSIEAVDIEKQNSAGQLESSPGGKQSPIAEFNAKIAKLLDDAKRNPLRFAMGVGGYYLPENKNELENRINYISEKTGISFTKSKNTNSWYGEYKGNKIRVSDHFSKFEEKNKNGKDFHFADSDNAIIKQIKGENPFSEYKKGDKITHSYAPIGEVIFVSNNHKEGYVQVIDKDGNTRKFDEGKFFGKEQGNIRFLSTPQGEVYGFVKDGKIYLDPAKLSPELIAEEYTHIQQQALRLAANNADRAAQKIVSAWDKATGRLADAIIKGMSAGGMSARAKALLKQMGIAESELASEVYQRQDGESAAAYKTRLQDELWAKAQKSSFAKYLETLAAENKLGVTTRELYEALKDFAKYIAKQLGIYNEKEWGRLTLPQLIERTNKELSSGKWLDKLEITTQDKAAEWSDNLQRANDRFNEELANFDNLPQGHVFQMGNAGAILQSTGVPDLPIELKAEKLKEKAASEKHPFDLPGAKDLPRAIQNPLAVFSYGDKNKAVNVITEIETNGKKMLVGISLNPTVQGKTLEINSVRNVFPKDTHEWVNWVNDGKGIYYDKEKLLSFLDQQRMNRSGQSPADVAFVLPDKQVKQENLEAATKIIKDFENPISDADVENVRWSAGREITMPDGTKQTVRRIAADVVNGFYSPIENAVHGLKQAKGTAAQMLQMIRQGKGVKADELQWTGIEEWLQSKGDERVTKQEILDYMKDNRVQFMEVVKGKGRDLEWVDDGEKVRTKDGELWIDDDGQYYQLNQKGFGVVKKAANIETLKRLAENYDLKNPTKFSKYQLPGEANNYREVLVMMPIKTKIEKSGDKERLEILKQKRDELLRRGESIRDVDSQIQLLSHRIDESVDFRSSHFDEPNIVGRLRMSDRTDTDGNNVLHIEELQSDWGQKGKKEGFDEKYKAEEVKPINENDNNPAANDPGRFWYFEVPGNILQIAKSRYATQKEAFDYVVNEKKKIDSGVPQAPFVTNTSWTKLLAKYAIKEAANSGADKITWTSGETQNERYDLSKQVDAIHYVKERDGTYSFNAEKDGDENAVFKNYISEKELESFVGKDVAKRMINGEGEKRRGVGVIRGAKTLRGQDLQVGGSGMKGFYGIVPQQKTFGNTPLNDVSLGIANGRITNQTLQKLEQYAREIKEGRAAYGRFTQRELEGFNRGGEIHAQASLLIGRNEVAGVEAQAGRTEREEKELEKYAKKKGVWHDNADTYLKEKYGEHFASGKEAKVYPDPSRQVVIKSKDTFEYPDVQHFLDGITLHNTDHPETAQRVIGFGRNAEGDFVALIEQPHIQAGKEKATTEEIKQFAKEDGYTEDETMGDAGTHFKNELTHKNDLHDENVLKGIDGKLYAIDTTMKLNKTSGARDIKNEIQPIHEKGHTGIVGKAFQEAVKDITGEKNVKIGKTEIDAGEDGAKIQHSIDITPEMREAVGEGIAMFQAKQKETNDIRFNIVGGNANLSQTQKASLVNAEALDKKGISADKIWAATGWQKDKNGNWQTDAAPIKVPQSLVDKFKLAQSGEIITEKLGDLVHLGELGKLYPELATLQVEIFNDETTEDYANFETVNTRDGRPIQRIAINSKREVSRKYNSSGYYTGSRPGADNRAGSQRGVGLQQVGRETSDFGQVQLTQLLTHEIQHWVQQKEGWPTASNLSKQIDAAKNDFIAQQRQQVARFTAEGNANAAGVVKDLRY